jgi:hypothetical protein
VNHRSLAFRLSVWYALILSATFTLVGTGIFYGLEQYLRSNLSDSLRRRSAQVEQILAQAPIGVTDAEIAESINTRVAPDFNNRFVRVTRAPAAVLSLRSAGRSQFRPAGRTEPHRRVAAQEHQSSRGHCAKSALLW